jgi:hypothetical protein
VAGSVRRKVTGERMATDLSKYYAELRRLRLGNPKLDRTMLEHCLRTLYRDELEKLKLHVSASVVRSKAANGGQVKTGQRTWPGT